MMRATFGRRRGPIAIRAMKRGRVVLGLRAG
jgi:hypothetical protein